MDHLKCQRCDSCPSKQWVIQVEVVDVEYIKEEENPDVGFVEGMSNDRMGSPKDEVRIKVEEMEEPGPSIQDPDWQPSGSDEDSSDSIGGDEVATMDSPADTELSYMVAAHGDELHAKTDENEKTGETGAERTEGEVRKQWQKVLEGTNLVE